MGEFLKYEVLQQSAEDPKIKPKGSTKLKHEEINVPKALDFHFPPKRITEDGEVKTLHVSRKQSTTFEIKKLASDFDDKLKELEAEETGFSKTLLDAHFQLFDELIRQEVIACPERGLLLVEVRDQFRQQLKSMQKLYRSCFAFAVAENLLSRKHIIQKRGEIPRLEKEIYNLNETQKNMRKEWQDAKNRQEQAEYIRMIERTFVENRLVIANKQMVKQIEDVIDSEHKWLKDLDSPDE